MKYIYLAIGTPGTSEVVFDVPIPPDKAVKVRGMSVIATTAQTSTGISASVGKNGAAAPIFSCSEASLAASTQKNLSFDGSATAAIKNQVFDKDTPMEVKLTLADADGNATICLEVDEFATGPEY